MRQIVDDLRALLKKRRIALPAYVDLEISHHYGLERFREKGAVLIHIINRAYSKMLVIMFPASLTRGTAIGKRMKHTIFCTAIWPLKLKAKPLCSRREMFFRSTTAWGTVSKLFPARLSRKWPRPTSWAIRFTRIPSSTKIPTAKSI